MSTAEIVMSIGSSAKKISQRRKGKGSHPTQVIVAERPGKLGRKAQNFNEIDFDSV